MTPWLMKPVTLRPYQAEDVATLTQRIQAEGATMALHEQGLGKTLMALKVAHDLGALRTLIHCPKIALISWAEEIAQWTTARFRVIKSAADVRRMKHADGYDIIVCTFDLAKSAEVKDWLRAWGATFGILDEAQYLRNPTTKRTLAIYARRDGTMADVKQCLIMSGTIIVSWPIDLWPHLARFAPHRIRDDAGQRIEHTAFLHRYHVVVEREIPGTMVKRQQIVRTINAEDLHHRIQGFGIRRLKSEVAKDLPSLTWRRVGVQFEPKHVRALADALAGAGVSPELIAMFERQSAAGATEDALRTITESRTAVSTITRVLGEVKAPVVADALDDELAETKYAVGVLYWNTAVGDAFATALAKHGVVRVDGSTSLAGRQAAVDAFRRADGPRVFLGQIQACGTALTLVRASRAICAQLSWTPGENAQAVARFHRIGQTEPVDVRVPVFADTIDDAFHRVLVRKQAAAAAVIDDVA